MSGTLLHPIYTLRVVEAVLTPTSQEGQGEGSREDDARRKVVGFNNPAKKQKRLDQQAQQSKASGVGDPTN
jgi:hypothetical protein